MLRNHLALRGRRPLHHGPGEGVRGAVEAEGPRVLGRSRHPAWGTEGRGGGGVKSSTSRDTRGRSTKRPSPERRRVLPGGRRGTKK